MPSGGGEGGPPGPRLSAAHLAAPRRRSVVELDRRAARNDRADASERLMQYLEATLTVPALEQPPAGAAPADGEAPRRRSGEAAGPRAGTAAGSAPIRRRVSLLETQIKEDEEGVHDDAASGGDPAEPISRLSSFSSLNSEPGGSAGPPGPPGWQHEDIVSQPRPARGQRVQRRQAFPAPAGSRDSLMVKLYDGLAHFQTEYNAGEEQGEEDDQSRLLGQSTASQVGNLRRFMTAADHRLLRYSTQVGSSADRRESQQATQYVQDRMEAAENRIERMSRVSSSSVMGSSRPGSKRPSVAEIVRHGSFSKVRDSASSMERQSFRGGRWSASSRGASSVHPSRPGSARTIGKGSFMSNRGDMQAIADSVLNEMEVSDAACVIEFDTPLRYFSFDGEYDAVSMGKTVDLQKMREDPLEPFMIGGKTAFHRYWKLFISMLVLYTATLIPYFMGFEVSPTESSQIFDIFVDISFILDIIFAFRTQIVLPDGSTISHPDDIRFLVLRNPHFYLDVIAAAPVGIIQVAVTTDINLLPLRLVKITRVVRVGAAIKQLITMINNLTTNLRVGEGDVARMLMMAFYLLLLAHWGACMYGYATLQRDFDRPFWIGDPFVDYRDLKLDHYLVSFTWAMTILTGIGCSLNPTDRVEAGLMLFMLVGGVFAYAVILGNVYSIMQNVGQDERDFRKHIESLMNFLDYRQVKDKELKQKIVGHFNRVWQKSKGIEEDAMLRSLGRPLRLEVLNNLNAAILDKIPCLAGLNNLQKSLFCDNLMSHHLQKGDALIVTGEEVRLLYFVMKGRVLLFSQSDERHLSEGYVIGMDELLTNQVTYGYSVVALGDDTQVCTVPAEDFWTVAAASEALRTKMEKIERAIEVSSYLDEKSDEVVPDDFMNPTALLNRHPQARRTNKPSRMANALDAMMAKQKGTATTSEKVKSISSKWRAAAKSVILTKVRRPEEEAGAEAGSSDKKRDVTEVPPAGEAP